MRKVFCLDKVNGFKLGHFSEVGCLGILFGYDVSLSIHLCSSYFIFFSVLCKMFVLVHTIVLGNLVTEREGEE